MSIRFTRFRTLAVALALVGGALVAPARAEDGEPQGLEAKLRQQMEKIIELMRENEEALLRLSTGAEATPKKVDVRPDLPPSSEQAQGGGSGSSESGRSGSGGEEIRRKLDELMKTQRSGSRQIPGELEKLSRMIPQGGGQGQGQPQPGEQPSGEGEKPTPRDGRRPESERRGEGEPEGGQESPRDPRDRTDGERKPEQPETEDPQSNTEPGWVTALPPEYRDAAAAGALERIPERYRETVKRYLLWLAKQKTPR